MLSDYAYLFACIILKIRREYIKNIILEENNKVNEFFSKHHFGEIIK